MLTSKQRIWFHKSRAVVWAITTLIVLKWFPDSIVYVIIASGYANVVSDWTMAAAVKADNTAMLKRIEANQKAILKRLE